MRQRMFRILMMAILALGLGPPCVGRAEEPALPSALTASDLDGLEAVRSDDEAKTYFSVQLRTALDLKPLLLGTSAVAASKTKAPPSQVLPAEWTDLGGRLAAELAAKQLAARLKRAVNTGDSQSLRTALEQADRQHLWLANETRRPELHRAIRLAAVLSDFSAVSLQPSLSPDFAPYAAYLDRTYPNLTDTAGSWLDVAERQGSPGIKDRLKAFWEHGPAPAPGASEDEQQRLAAVYFHTRLWPVLMAQTLASTIRAEASAEQRVRAHWIDLKTWPDKMREAQALARLCGTWQWTIHNHQHHQDQKIAMVFPPPDASTYTGPRPAKTVILGDAIYLRWEFPGMVQEDSLLFTGEGQRLEGSFVNSSGAWGSITGKRIAPCTP